VEYGYGPPPTTLWGPLPLLLQVPPAASSALRRPDFPAGQKRSCDNDGARVVASCRTGAAGGRRHLVVSVFGNVAARTGLRPRAPTPGGHWRLGQIHCRRGRSLTARRGVTTRVMPRRTPRDRKIAKCFGEEVLPRGIFQNVRLYRKIATVTPAMCNGRKYTAAVKNGGQLYFSKGTPRCGKFTIFTRLRCLFPVVSFPGSRG